MSAKETAKDVLRRMLDERGVGHTDEENSTYWVNDSGVMCKATECLSAPTRLWLIRNVTRITPELAIALTLGEDELELEDGRIAAVTFGETRYVPERTMRPTVVGDLGGDFDWTCGECGHNEFYSDVPAPSFCPACGAKAVFA